MTGLSINQLGISNNQDLVQKDIIQWLSWVCPKCKQAIPDPLPINVNSIVDLDELIRFRDEKIKYDAMVKTHNDNRGFFDAKWSIKENWLFYFIEARFWNLRFWKKTIHITAKPQEKKNKFIKCPLCGYIHDMPT